MKKTKILNVLLALVVLAVIGVTGCNNTTDVTIEVPKYEDPGPNPPSGDPQDVVITPAVEKVELKVTPTSYGFVLSWPPVIEAATYDIWRSTEGIPAMKLNNSPIAALPNTVMKYYDVMVKDGDGANLKSETEYTYSVFVRTRNGQVRDSATGEETAESLELLAAADAKLPAPVLTLTVDGKARTITYKMAAPDLEDLILPRDYLKDVSLTWKITRTSEGKADTDTFTTLTGTNLLALLNKGAAGIGNTLKETEITDLIDTFLNDSGSTWYDMAGTYVLSSKYTLTNVSGFFSGADGEKETVYKNYFGFDDGNTTTIDFDVDSDVVLICDNFSAGSTLVYGGKAYATINLLHRGVPGTSYKLERLITKDNGTTWEPEAAASQPLMGAPTGTLTPDRLLKTTVANLDLTIELDDKATWLPTLADNFAPVVAADLKTDSLGIFPVSPIFDPTINAVGGTQYKYRLYADVDGNYDYADTAGFATVADFNDNGSITPGLTLTSVPGTTTTVYTVVPTVTDSSKDVSSLLLDGDYIRIDWGYSSYTSTSQQFEIQKNFANSTNQTVTWTWSRTAGNWGTAPYTFTTLNEDTDEGRTALWVVVTAKINGKLIDSDAMAISVTSLFGDKGTGVATSTQADATIDINGVKYIRLFLNPEI